MSEKQKREVYNLLVIKNKVYPIVKVTCPKCGERLPDKFSFIKVADNRFDMCCIVCHSIVDVTYGFDSTIEKQDLIEEEEVPQV